MTACKAKTLFEKALCIAQCKLHITETYFTPLALIAARAYIGRVFWRSGQTKIENLENAKMLFEWEYLPNWEKNAQNVLGVDLSWTVPSAGFAATLTTFAELGLPILLVIGLAGRVSAFLLLLMAVTIEVFVYPGTTEHYYWMIVLAILVTTGPGKISIDHFIRKKFLEEKSA